MMLIHLQCISGEGKGLVTAVRGGGVCQPADLAALPQRPGGSCCPPAVRALAARTPHGQERLHMRT